LAIDVVGEYFAFKRRHDRYQTIGSDAGGQSLPGEGAPALPAGVDIDAGQHALSGGCPDTVTNGHRRKTDTGVTVERDSPQL
jgi:hypothetical protein